MPGHRQHCEDCETRLGKPFPEVHSWMDALYNGEDPMGHRDSRHNLAGVEEVRRQWGDQAAEAAKLHIMLDWELTREQDIPKDQKEAEQFRFVWIARMPHLEESHG